MSQNTRRMIGTALTLAALFTTGCHVQIVPAVGVVGNPPVTAKQETGSVKVAFQGQTGYETLATRYDVHHVKLTLQPERGKAQEREVYLQGQDLSNIEFKKVSTGKAVLSVVAFDVENRAIGKGVNSAFVGAKEAVFIHVAVKLQPEGDGGDVNALITFEDGLDEDNGFHQADLDGDGYLDRGEYRNVYYRLGVPVPTPTPMYAVDPVPPSYLTQSTPVMPNCIPPQPEDAAMSAFNQKDWDRDGRLNLDEYLGRVYAVPMTGTTVAATPMPGYQD
jgi:hypothetical protein